jgi:hypothetical protein
MGALATIAQQGSTSQNASTRADYSLEAKIDALSATLDQTRAELEESRDEIRQLKVILETVTQKLGTTSPQLTGSSTLAQVAGPEQTTVQPNGPATVGNAQISQDDWEVLNSRVDQERQVKVESGSKFPLRLSGMLLLNTVINSGRVDNFDLPTEAVTSTTPAGSMGFSLRQSVIGIEGTGPQIAGAQTSADIQADFYGGLSTAYGAADAGVMRLRLARVRFDWHDTSIIGGIDTPFFSPEAPTSYLTVAEPGFSGSGNLWTWAPQIRVEQRFDGRLAQFRVEAGVLNLSSYAASLSGKSVPSPTEASRQPIYALRLSANGRNEERPFSLGVAGVFVTQHFPGSVDVNGASGSADWNVPLVRRVSLSGEIFAGKGLDAFGGAPEPSVTTQNYVQYITSSAPLLAKVGAYGGWSQFNFRVNSRSEVNFGAGGASRDTNAFRVAAATDSIVNALPFKNESLMINYIFRPRSDLLFSAEYRRLRTYLISGTSASAGETGLSAGFIF